MQERQPPPASASTATNRQEGLLDRAAGVILSPGPTFRSIAATRPVGQAMLVTLVGTGIAGAAALGPSTASAGGQGGLGPAGIALGFILGLLLGIPVTAAAAGLYHVAARVLGQQTGTYAGLFTVFGYINTLLVLQAPLALIAVVGGAIGTTVSGSLGLALTVWMLVLTAVAVRANYRTGVGVAIGVLVLAVVGAIVAAVGVAVLIVVLLLLGLLAALR